MNSQLEQQVIDFIGGLTGSTFDPLVRKRALELHARIQNDIINIKRLHIPKASVEKWKDMLNQNMLVKTMKEIRMIYGISIAESKDIADEIRAYPLL